MSGQINSKHYGRKKLRRKIREHNEEVDYNNTIWSWIVGILACLIFFPYYGSVS